MLSRYSRWDGTQQIADLDADDVLRAISDDLLADGDLASALRRLSPSSASRKRRGRTRFG